MELNINLEYQDLNSSIYDFFDQYPYQTKQLQTYIPIMDNYRKFHNDPEEHKNYILTSRFNVNKIYINDLNTLSDFDYNYLRKCYFNAIVYDSFLNKTTKINCFIKTVSILNPVSIMKNEYNKNSK